MTLVDHLALYASSHRHRRNIATHFVGIPLIVVAVEALLARVGFSAGGIWVSAAHVVTLATLGYYLSLDARFALAMTGLCGVALWLGTVIAAQSAQVWLWTGVGLFVVGWVFQFIGHAFEGKRPAFLDDVRGLLIGPLFIAAEVGFMLGLRDELRAEIERRAGPTRGSNQLSSSHP